MENTTRRIIGYMFEIPHRYNSYWLTKKEVIPSSYIVKYNEGCFYIYSEDAFYNKYDIVIKVKE